jgi:hypothetical protein
MHFTAFKFLSVIATVQTEFSSPPLQPSGEAAVSVSRAAPSRLGFYCYSYNIKGILR